MELLIFRRAFTFFPGLTRLVLVFLFPRAVVFFSSPDAWCFCFCSPRAMVSFLSSPDSWCFRFFQLWLLVLLLFPCSGFWCFCYFPPVPLLLFFGGCTRALARGPFPRPLFALPPFSCLPLVKFVVSSPRAPWGKKGHSFVLQKEHKERQNRLSKSLFIFRRRTWCPHELLLNHGPNWASG